MLSLSNTTTPYVPRFNTGQAMRLQPQNGGLLGIAGTGLVAEAGAAAEASPILDTPMPMAPTRPLVSALQLMTE